MSYNNPNQPRQPPMQHPGMPPGSGPGQQSMMRRPPMMPQKILITEANLVENVARLPEQVQQKINSLPSLEEKVRTTQTWIENAIMRRFQQQQQQAPNPQQMNMQQSQRQLGSGPGQGMPGQHMAQQRMNMQ
uniref:Uncharacterized protein n=1 Tax=Panagrolaimus sp. JU765 TaxID=591449 RepID=A0AC34QAB9_9BILA